MKNKFSPFPKLILGAFVSIFLLVQNPIHAHASYTYYQEMQSENLMPGVTYESRKRVTDIGMVNIHVLRVDLTSPFVRVGTAYGEVLAKKQATSSILTYHDAMAGVNGDFFGMAGQYSGPLGLSIADGVASHSESLNKDALAKGTFYLTDDNQAIMDYFSTKISFMVEGEHVLPLGAVNKAFNIEYPIVLTGEMASSTQEVDNRYLSQKVVVDNGEIIRITANGETVEIPPNGFVLIIKPDHAFLETIELGQQAQVYIESSIQLSNIETAITGSDLILQNGQITSGVGVPTGRHPRTALGLSQDKETLIMVVVDGRSVSVGATHEEMGQIMLSLGATDALHLDGGGSSTMAAKTQGADSIAVKNKLSDNYERSVANVLAVFNDAPVGEATELVVKPASDTVIYGSSVDMKVYGLDDYLNKIQIPIESCEFIVTGGIYENGKIHAETVGEITVNISYGHLATTRTIQSFNVSELRASATSLTGEVASVTPLTFTGINEQGIGAPLRSELIQYSVIPSHLGVVENNQYISHEAGSGYLQCVYNGGVTLNIPIENVFEKQHFGSFDENTAQSTSTFPDGLIASTIHSPDHTVDTNGSLHMTYTFEPSESTQAAYINFPQIIIPHEAKALSTYVKGTGLHHWLRGKIVDAQGQSFTLEFSNQITSDFTEYIAYLPDEAVRPLQFTQIYMASLKETTPTIYDVYIDTLGIQVPTPRTSPIPPSNKYFDFWVRNNMEISALGDNFTVDIAKSEGQLTGGIRYLPIDSGSGSIMKTNVSQWKTIEEVIKGENTHIVIHLNQLPPSFSMGEEYELFHNLMLEGRKLGKEIIILANGETNQMTMIDGIRYISLSSSITMIGAPGAIYYHFN